MTFDHPIDEQLDLVLERDLDVPPEALWAGWTTPELLVRWFTPAPYETIHAEIDLRPGGTFRVVMRSPEGEEIDGGAGCVLEVVDGERLTWTSALGPGFRPLDPGDEFAFTAVIGLERIDGGTRYTARAIHQDAEGAARHREMGFHEGWGAALDQLVELARTLDGA